MNGTYKENRMNSQQPAARRQTVNMRNVYVAGFFAAAALLLVLSMFLFFNVSEIKIEGVTLYEQDQILGVGGVSTGQNLVRTNTDIVEKRLKDTLVYLDDVKVTKKFPSTLVITCTEAEKAADIEYKNSYYVLSASGKILETKNPAPTGDIPVVKGFELKSLSQGDKLASEDSFKADILEELLDDLHELKFKNIDSIDLTTRSDIKLMYDGRLEIKLGSSVDMEYKLTYLKAVIDESILTITRVRLFTTVLTAAFRLFRNRRTSRQSLTTQALQSLMTAAVRYRLILILMTATHGTMVMLGRVTITKATTMIPTHGTAIMTPTMQAQISGQTRTETPTGDMITAAIRGIPTMDMLTTAMWTVRRTQIGRGQDN